MIVPENLGQALEIDSTHRNIVIGAVIGTEGGRGALITVEVGQEIVGVVSRGIGRLCEGGADLETRPQVGDETDPVKQNEGAADQGHQMLAQPSHGEIGTGEGVDDHSNQD